MKAQQIFDYIWQIAPNPPFCDENIIEYGDGATEVKAIGVAWWITSDMLEEFDRKGINVGITHERVIYDIPDTYPWGKPPKTFDLVANTRVRDLVKKHNVTIHRFHGNIDLCDWGMPHALFDVLGWSGYPIDWSRGVPVVEHPSLTLRELIDELKAKLRLPFVRYDGDLDRVVRRVSVPWGGMCQWWTGAACAAPIGCDVVVGGDAIDGVVRFAREQGWATIDAFHHATEMPAMEVLTRKVREKFPSVPVHYFENTMPWAAR